jgi:chromosome segregation ATPase
MKKTDKMKSPKGNKIKKTEEPFMTIDELAIIINRSFDEVCKRLSNLETRLSAVEDRLSVVEKRLSVVEERLSVVEERLSLVENRLTAVEERLESVDERLCYVERAVHELRYKIVETNDSIHYLSKRVDVLEGAK